ncbi:MAG: PKD domain-containing protein [Thermoplasmatales archaeon]|nr:PKD domain-containing protein [Thermoplasmatales archaeon]
MKTKIICISVITLLIASAVLPVAGTMKVHIISKEKTLEYTNVQNEVLGLPLDDSWRFEYNNPQIILSDGAIWTTLNDCGDIQQNVNHYYVGDDVYANGDNFDPYTQYNWYVKGQPSSCDPNTIVASGTVITDSAGAFCFNAYTIQEGDCGVYRVNVGNKNDNFNVVTPGNDPPIIYNPNPANGTTDVPLTLSELSVTIEDPEGDSMDWTITTSPDIGSSSGTGEGNGTKTCSVSGLEYETTYTWTVTATDPSGSGNTTSVSFTFTTISNNPPVISNPNPSNGATDVSTTISELSVTIEDPEGDTIDWTITTSPNIGSDSGTGESNGTKTCSVSGLQYDTTYTWYVTATDPDGSGETTTETYTFTTVANNPPVISNPDPEEGATEIPITLAELTVTIEDPDGDPFDWTITTSPDIGSSSGTGESGGTKTCSVSGLEFETTYTWVVTASDSGSRDTAEETYTFTTMSNDPPEISNPDPSNGATEVSVGLSELSVTIEDPEGDSIDWSITTSPDIGSSSGTGETGGTKTCSVSDLDYGITYTWVVSATDPDGSGETTEETYTFTTNHNLPPIIFDPDPEDDMTGVSIYGTELSVTIEDPEGDNFHWTITTSPDVGSSSGFEENNGTKLCDIICGLEYNTTYTWYVEATDVNGSGQTTEEVYTFTTEIEGNNPPVISNPDPSNGATNIPITITELSVTIEDPEGDYFDWSIETTPDIGSSSGTGESNGTKTCGISGLEYETTYRWKVEATDPDGSGRTKQRVCTFTTELEPLNTPSTPEGPTSLDVGESGEYCTSTTHPDGNQVQYLFDWDAEGSHDYSYWSELVSSGTEVCVENSWSNWGMYVVKAQARDEFGTTSDWSDGLTVAVGNHPPNTPTINGPASGKPGTSYTYTFTATDPDTDDIAEYIVNWGDGPDETITGPFASGSPATASHTWNTKGTYTIKAKAKDIYGAESDWGELEVTMPRNRIINRAFLNFLQNYPYLMQLLQRLLKP